MLFHRPGASTLVQKDGLVTREEFTLRLATVLLDGEKRVIAQEPDTGIIRDLTGIVGSNLRDAFEFRPEQLQMADQFPIDLATAVWLPPVVDPQKIFCVGFNYSAHAAEGSANLPDHPTLFTRFASSFVGHQQAVLTPRESATLDWEGEIVVVIGRGGRRIAVQSALSHVAGYSLMAENSVRQFQLHGSQATAGKNWDRSGSWGPWIITADEVLDPAALQVVTRLNGAEKQRGHLSNLIFDIPTLISYVSTFTALAPGDVIATGTPAGIGYRENPPRFLREGDELSVELVGFTTLQNHVVQDPA